MSDHDNTHSEGSPSEDEISSSDDVCVSDGESDALAEGSEEPGQKGDEPLKEIWKNWKSFEIKKYKTSRSACPHYKGNSPHGAGGDDKDQSMDTEAVKKLKKKKVKYIISANMHQLGTGDKLRLEVAGIGYKWLRVIDDNAPSPQQFKAAHTAWKKHKKKHVHFYCGWGDGRAGTLIAGVKILEGVYPGPVRPSHQVWREEKVETGVQLSALDALWDDWKKSH